MSINITRINLSNFGPLKDQVMELGKLNLIYGPNESGKTFLTEFILQSIFKYPKISNWPLREIPGQGKVYLSGLEKEETEFSPKSRMKIEDFWADNSPGLPTNMARLLVVKGGELSLVQSNKETNLSFLKNVISQDILFEQLLSNIPKTIQKAEIKEGEIIGENRGDIRLRKDILDSLKRLKRLINDIGSVFSFGEIQVKEQELNQIKEKIETQEAAKKYHAYLLDSDIEALQKKLIPDDDLEILRDDLNNFYNSISQLEKWKTELQEKNKIIQNFLWLGQAIRSWEIMGLETTKRPILSILIISLVLFSLGFSAGLIRIFLDLIRSIGVWNIIISILSLVFLLGSLGFAGLYMFRLNHWANSISCSTEREAIIEEFTNRFNMRVRCLTDLKTHLESIRNEYINVDSLPGKISELEKDQENLSIKIGDRFTELVDYGYEDKDWQNYFQEIKKDQKELKRLVDAKNLELARLNIPKEDYVSCPFFEPYDEGKLAELLLEKARKVREFEEINSKLRDLKVRACQEVEEDLIVDWSQIIDKIQSKQEKYVEEYKNVTAKIIGEIAISRILQDLQVEEEEKIRRGLQTKEIENILSKITQHYGSVDFFEDGLLIKGDYSNYILDDLSSGTKEQVYLAIRMGFASKLAGGDPLFMILDDAFQHSDWNRRDRLIDVVFELVELGWQFTYLTMDDHIRNSFKKLGEKKLGKEFHYFQLAEN